jgi:hypothetical protein
MDGQLNKQRVTEWRNRKYAEGCKSLTVFLPSKIIGLVPYLRRFYQLRCKASEVIALAIENLYKKALSERNRND